MTPTLSPLQALYSAMSSEHLAVLRAALVRDLDVEGGGGPATLAHISGRIVVIDEVLAKR